MVMWDFCVTVLPFLVPLAAIAGTFVFAWYLIKNKPEMTLRRNLAEGIMTKEEFQERMALLNGGGK